MRPTARSLARAAAAALVALAAGAAPAAGQFAAPRPAPRPSTQTASINLLGLPFGFVSGEYERTVGREGLAFGLGGVASFDDNDASEIFVGDNYYNDDPRYSSLQAKLKYYPSARGLRGFAVGVTAGFASASGREQRLVAVDSFPTSGGFTRYEPRYTSSRASVTRPTVGTVLDYNFLLGPRQRFLVGLGVGARRTLGSEGQRTDTYEGPFGYSTYGRVGLNRTLFDGRLQVGFGF